MLAFPIVIPISYPDGKKSTKQSIRKICHPFYFNIIAPYEAGFSHRFSRFSKSLKEERVTADISM